MHYKQLRELNDYLLSRFKERVDYINIIRPHIAEVESKNFSILKTQLMEFLNDVVDDLRQSTQSLKTMQAHENEILENLNSKELELHLLKSKNSKDSYNNNNYNRNNYNYNSTNIENLEEKYSELMKENLNIKKKELDKDILIIELNDKKNYLERQLRLKEETIQRYESQFKSDSDNNININNAYVEDQSTNKKANNVNNPNYLNSEMIVIENNNINTDNNESGNVLSLNSINNRPNSVGNTLKNIMTERELQKNKINNAINEHLSSSKTSKLQLIPESEEIKVNQNVEINSNAYSPRNNNITNLSTHNENDKQESMINKISDLVRKINSDSQIYDHLYKIFGREFIHKLVTSVINDEYVEKIYKSVQNFEQNRSKPNFKYDFKSSASHSKNKSLAGNEGENNNLNNFGKMSLSSLRSSHNESNFKTLGIYKINSYFLVCLLTYLLYLFTFLL